MACSEGANTSSGPVPGANVGCRLGVDEIMKVNVRRKKIAEPKVAM